MKKNLTRFLGVTSLGMGAALLALCAFTPVSHAALYDITFTSTSGSVQAGSGLIDVVGGLATSGSFTVTTGAVGTYNLTPGGGISPLGSFVYDSQVNPGNDPFLTSSGLLFSSGSNEINFTGLGAGSYRFNTDIGGSFTISDGLGTITPVPEPINYALAAFGLIIVGGSAGRFYFGHRRSATAS